MTFKRAAGDGKAGEHQGAGGRGEIEGGIGREGQRAHAGGVRSAHRPSRSPSSPLCLRWRVDREFAAGQVYGGTRSNRVARAHQQCAAGIDGMAVAASVPPLALPAVPARATFNVPLLTVVAPV